MSIVTSSSRLRFTRNTEVSPLSASQVATASTTGTSPYRPVEYVGQSSFSSSVTPRARREVTANGKNVVWRHAGPPGSVMIGAMTFTSCARLAAVTRSAWRIKRDEQAAEDDGIHDGVRVLEQSGRDRPLVDRR